MKQDSATWKFKTQKSDGNIYSNFEEKFGAFISVYFIYTTPLQLFQRLGQLLEIPDYSFKAWEVMIPTLQTVCKLELK